MKKLTLFLSLMAITVLSFSQVASRIIITQSVPQAIDVPNLCWIDNTPGQMNRWFVVDKNYIRFQTFNITGINDSVNKWVDSFGYLKRSDSAFYATVNYVNSQGFKQSLSQVKNGNNVQINISGSNGIGFNVNDGDSSSTNEIELPSQSGQSGKYLTTNGSSVSWSVVTPAKRQETYSGTTNAGGTYTVTYGTAYSVTPNVQFNIVGGAVTNTIRLTASSASGFTVYVQNRVDVVGLLPSYQNISGASVDILVTEK